MTKGQEQKKNGVKISSSINVGRSEQVHAKKMKFNNQFTPYTKINSTWIKNLNINCDTITVTCHRAKEIKERINKQDYVKLKSFCTAKENIKKMEREPAVGKHICQ